MKKKIFIFLILLVTGFLLLTNVNLSMKNKNSDVKIYKNESKIKNLNNKNLIYMSNTEKLNVKNEKSNNKIFEEKKRKIFSKNEENLIKKARSKEKQDYVEETFFVEIEENYVFDYNKAKKKLEQSTNKEINKLKDLYLVEELKIKKSEKNDSVKKIFFIEDIVFNNVIILEKDLKKIEVKYERKEFSFDDIEKIIEEANNLYLSNGYVTTRVKLKIPQNLETKKLELEVITGYIEDIKLNDNSFRDKSSLFMAFPFKKGKILKLQDIEQGILQLNTLQSNNAKMKILPGNDYGYSTIEVINQPTKRFTLVLGFDNMGQESTEKNRGKINLYLDNLIGLNDSITFNYQNTLNSDQDKKNSINYGLNLSIPFGYYTFSSGVSKSTYLNTVKGNNNIFTSSGDTLTHHYNLKKTLFNNAKGNAMLKASLMLKDDKNYIEGVKLEQSSKKLTVMKLVASRVFKINQGYISTSLGYHKGLDYFDALKNELAQFEKYTLDANYTKYFHVGNNQFSYNLGFNSQYANQILYGVEKINIGDLYTVRGFKNNSISGENGMYLRNTITYIFDKDLPILKSSSLFLGFDYGLTEDLSYQEGSKYEKIEKVAGLSMGYQFNSKNLSLDLTLSKPIEQPKYFEEEDYRLYVNISLIY